MQSFEQQPALVAAWSGWICQCGAEATYTIRESQRGYETIHRVCDTCFQRDFQNNEENCDGWEVVYAIPDGTDPDDFSDTDPTDPPRAALDPDEQPEPWPDRCGNCGGAHHIQACPEILDALPNPGRAIARQWSRDTLRFRAMLCQLDHAIWPVLAVPCARYREMTTAEVLDRWQRLVEGTRIPELAREAAA